MSIRDGKYAMVAYRNYKFPIDQEAVAALIKKIEAMVPEESSEDSGGGTFRSKLFNRKFSNKEAERLRIQFIRLNQFQESWIP